MLKDCRKPCTLQMENNATMALEDKVDQTLKSHHHEDL